jgi:hypothetical protein
MKKLLAILSICLSFTVITCAQKLNKKESTKILENAWNAIKNSDTAAFSKLWTLDKTQWPYHGGQTFGAKEIRDNYLDFRSYFDTALVKKLKFSEVTCDTVEHNDPHYEYAKYYITATFKYSNTHKAGFGFYMDYINNQWYVRFSPDYFDKNSSKK